ncbi:serine hydrolase domain-containing protein [Croceitalea rosinachiae]|uniref:Serine hydrolase domain-containing protein n=1 Tax=Croceitalea rosinachiae TaxID=3075596 RepID=A0ABU3AAC7_9FLAO|nr:serine hydrolase domain-containing protein [Croceitalea sp. F388]MDT0607136.1 serine hydrolase domain-containing protein [Croceitalea sp. F388]
MKNIFTLFLSFIYITSFSQEVQKRDVTAEQIDAIFSQWDTQTKPGIAVGILNDGEIVYTKGYGLANLEHQIPISSKTRFHIGDIAKEFTVYALLLLEQRGEFSLQDDIRKYLPKLKSFPYPISIQQLIHHTSGLNNLEVSKALAGWRTEDVFTKEQAYALILSQAKSLSINKNVQRFSDAGFMILEDLIAEVGKVPYADFVTKHIFEPLEMKNSIFDTEGAVISSKAQGYFAQKDGFVNTTMNQTHTILSDVYTTVGDMCLWAKELENPKIGTEEMTSKFDALSTVNSSQIKETNTALYTGAHRYWNFRGAKKMYHTEVAGGYASKLIRYPDYALAVVIMGNDGAYNGYAGTGASALYIEDFLDPVPDESEKIVSEKLSKKLLELFEGDYWGIDNHTTRKIYVANDTLRYSRSKGNESALLPLSKNSFKMITWNEVVVNFDSKSNSKTMSVKVGDNTTKFIAYETDASWTKDLSVFTGKYHAKALNTSYLLVLEEGKLVLNHSRLEPVQLAPRIKNVFTGNQRHFTSLEFKNGTNGNITGFKLSTRGVADIWFQKENSSNDTFMKTK